MGLLDKLTISEKEFPGGYFVYYDYQGHINSVQLFHQNLQKSLGIDTSKLTKMTITYDDPFNLKDVRTFRASLGFLFPQYDADLFAKFKQLHYEWKNLPKTGALYGEFPYRNSASLSFGATRFLPTCLTYILRNARRLKNVIQQSGRSGTIEVIDGKIIRYYYVIEKQKEFYLTTKEAPALKNEDKFTSIYYKKND